MCDRKYKLQGRRKSGIVLVDPMESLWDCMKRFGSGVDRVMVHMSPDDKGVARGAC